ncbi:SLATT domain-containing protein [Flavobacteriaceae bacterium]|nr:SLATT domain-containing protein [Flavobacteriaceae bacterium]
MNEKEEKFTGSSSYLEKSFLEELSFKIWSTKGARFQADTRLTKKSKLSTISLAFLSAYLIIASLLSAYGLNNGNYKDLINYSITALSILLLVISMFENNQNYKLRAKIYHDCGLEIGFLYSNLRTFKTLKKNKSDFEIYTFSKKMIIEYQNILVKYENHEPLDFDKFKTQKPDHFELTKKKLKKINRKYLWEIYGWYSIIIGVPPLIIITLFFTI